MLVIDSLYSLIAPIMNHNNYYYSSSHMMLQRTRTGSEHLQTIEIDVALQYNAIMAQLGLLFKKLSSDPINQTTIIMTNINPCHNNNNNNNAAIATAAVNLMPIISTNSSSSSMSMASALASSAVAVHPLFTTEQQCIGLENYLGPLWSMVDVTLLLAVKQIGRVGG